MLLGLPVLRVTQPGDFGGVTIVGSPQRDRWREALPVAAAVAIGDVKDFAHVLCSSTVRYFVLGYDNWTISPVSLADTPVLEYRILCEEENVRL